MRTLPNYNTEVTTAINTTKSYKMAVKAIVDPSRTYFSALTDDNPYNTGDSSGYNAVTDEPTGQCVVYNTNGSSLVTFVVDSTSGVIYGMNQGSDTKTSTGITADSDTKPSAWDLGNGTCYLWYCDAGVLKRRTVTYSGFSAGSPTTISPTPSPWSITRGSPTAVSSTEVVYVYQTTYGGWGVAYYTGSAWENWTGRFLSPNAVASTYPNATIYTTAAKFNGDIYVYWTDIKEGEVRATVYQVSDDLWTDSFVALPSDLSRFCITNAKVANGFIHLAGQFHRTDDLANAQVYSLALRSSNGKAFSWDRFTLISKLGYMFNVEFNGDTFYASDRNAVGTSTLSYFWASTPGTRVTLQPPNDIIEFSMNDVNATLRIKGYDEAYLNHAVIKKGSRCQIEIGYQTSEGMVYNPYMDFIIDKVTYGYADGIRRITLGLVAEGIWKTDQISFPFYSEIISNSSLYDDCDEWDLMYPAPGSIYRDADVFLDFFQHEGWDGGGVTTCTPAIYSGDARFKDGGLNPGAECIRNICVTPSVQTNLGAKTPVLNSLNDYSDYPVITSTSLIMNVYGWCSTSHAEDGTTITAYMITMDADDTETERTCAAPGNFDKDYNDTQTGVMPIPFSFTGLTVGHRIKQIMFKFSHTGGTAGNTSYTYIERMELSNCVVSYSNLNKGQFWTREKTASAGADDPNDLKVPSIGTPHILLLTKPYTAYNFSVWSTFEYSAGSSPISTGAVTWGVVGMAADAGNCLIGRFHKQNSELQLVKMRNGRETELATYDMGATIPASIKMDHRDGKIEVSYKNASDTWVEPTPSVCILEYYDEETEGPISTSDDQIMHIGSWAGIVPAGFRICSFGIGDCDGLAMMAGQPTSLISSLPSTGKVTIDEIIYSYTGKTPTAIAPRGPFQLRNTWLYGGYSEGYANFTGYGCEISHFDPNLSETYLQNYLLASDAGNAWTIEDTDWTVRHSTAGTPFYLFNRTRHFGDSIHNRHGLSTKNKMWETIGLTGVTRDPDQDVSQSYLHSSGSWAWQWGTDELWLTEAMGTAIENDSTVKDMTAFMCEVASVPSEYPGDWSTTSLAISGTPTQLAATERLLPGGYDVWFELPVLSAGQWVAIYASDLFIGGDTSTENIDIGFRNNGGTIEVYSVPDQSTYDPVYVETGLSTAAKHSVRVLFHQNFITVYADNVWLHTFAYPEEHLHWPDDELDMYIYASTSKTVDSVTVVELFDWREAIYVESELSAQSAIGSVIQERPVEIFPTSDGGLSFSYNLKRDTITYSTAHTKVMFRRHEETDQGNREAGSDAIVYYADVDFVTDNSFADDQGFLTRVLKLSTLDTGADRAAQILLEKANEHQYMHNLEIRPDMRIEYGDVLSFTYTMTGTGTSIQRDVIVESISLTIQEGSSRMSITARKDIP